jgi:hypothetical protein
MFFEDDAMGAGVSADDTQAADAGENTDEAATTPEETPVA